LRKLSITTELVKV